MKIQNDFHHALRYGNKKEAQILLKKGADPFRNNCEAFFTTMEQLLIGSEPFTKDFFETIVWLFSEFPNYHERDSQALGMVCSLGCCEDYEFEYRLELVKFFLERGADVNSNDGWSLASACHNHDYELVKLLIENGADVSLNSNFAMRRHSCFTISKRITTLLLAHGADRNACKKTKTNLETIKEIDEPFTRLKKKYIEKRKKKIESELLTNSNMYRDVISVVNGYM